MAPPGSIRNSVFGGPINTDKQSSLRSVTVACGSLLGWRVLRSSSVPECGANRDVNDGANVVGLLHGQWVHFDAGFLAASRAATGGMISFVN